MAEFFLGASECAITITIRTCFPVIACGVPLFALLTELVIQQGLQVIGDVSFVIVDQFTEYLEFRICGAERQRIGTQRHHMGQFAGVYTVAVINHTTTVGSIATID
jgi:hypothetical protein